MRPRIAAPAALLALAASAWGQAGFKETAREESMAETIAAARGGTATSGERIAAIRKLGETRDPQTVEKWNIIGVLVQVSEDPSPRVQRAAAEAMGQLAMGADPAIKQRIREPLVKVARDESNNMLGRTAAVRVLGQLLSEGEFGDREAIAALVGLASDERTDPEIAAAVLVELGRIGSARARDVIRSAVAHRNPAIQEAGVKALKLALTSAQAKSFPDPALGGHLMRLLSGASLTPEMREDLIMCLSLLIRTGVKVSGVDRILNDALATEDRESTLIEVLKAATLVGEPSVVGGLVACYGRFDPKLSEGKAGSDTIRMQVCVAAGEFLEGWARSKGVEGASAAAQRLSDLLVNAVISDGSDAVKKQAVYSLGNLYDPMYDRRKPVQVLIARLGQEGTAEDLRMTIIDSLEALTNTSFKADYKRWERWEAENRRSLAPRR
jgi:hypothetical protein